MKLELNLVSSNNTFDVQFKLIERKRIFVEDNNPLEALEWCFKFLADNISVIEASTSNTELVRFLSAPKDYTISDLMCVKYLLTLSGLDFLVYALADGEDSNPDGIADDEIEYTLLDFNYVSNSFIPTASKVTMNKLEANLYSIYKKIIEDNSLFNKKYLLNDNVLMPSVKVLEETYLSTSKEPAPIVSGIEIILGYLGKTYQIMTSND